MHTLHRPLMSMCLSRPLALMSLSTVAASSLSVEPLKTRQLGSSSLRVTEACLGTMTWGIQNSEEDGHAQLDYAIKERGVNFVDTAELSIECVAHPALSRPHLPPVNRPPSRSP